MYPVDGDEDWLPRRLAVFLDKASEWRTRLQGVAETAGDAPSLDTSAFIKV